MTINGAMDTAMLRPYVNEMLVPTLTSGGVVVMDNLSAHKVTGIRDAIEAAGAQVLCLLQAKHLCTREGLKKALDCAIDLGAAADARSWFADRAILYRYVKPLQESGFPSLKKR